jgi:acetyl-CoA C-acetyltransferase
MPQLKEAVIVSSARTAIGSFNGVFRNIPATRLGSIVIDAVLDRAGLDKDQVNEVIMGCVLPANLGQAPARQAALGAGLNNKTECMTINKVCGSGLKSVMLAAQAVMTGDADIIVAGGMENMTRTPYYLEQARFGSKLGHTKLVDGIIRDGLWDVYNDFHMGSAAELCARENNISREEQDQYTELSYKRALTAQKEGLFNQEIVEVEIPQRKGDSIIITEDEEPSKVDFEKLKSLQPVFEKGGTVTAANASSINDGAAAVLVMSDEMAGKLGLKPEFRIVAQSSAAKLPEQFTTAPADAVNRLLKKAGMTKDEIDFYEINEAFAVVSLINNRLLGLPVEKVNINGGAVALGHPIGASGARILTTLIHTLKNKNAKRGIASLCIGGGEASALLIESI